MANILGTLLVELGVNVGAYIKGMDAASYKAKQTGREIQEGFNKLGDSLSGVLGQFGVFGQVIGESLSKVGDLTGKVTANFGSMGAAFGTAAVSGAAAGAAIAALGIGALDIAKHAAESAAKLYELSQITGVSAETLSRFGYAARQNGVESDTMTKSLERLSKSAFAAATAPAGAVNAYTRLGIALKDSSGNMRPVEALMGDVADKFGGMENGASKTALAMQIFGRGGAAIIPMLNEGREAMAKWAAEADAFGVTISSTTAYNAHLFEQSMAKMKDAGTGLSNQLLSDLLPAMQTLATEIVNDLKDPQSSLRNFIDVLAWCGKVVLSVGELIVATFGQIKAAIWGTIGTVQEVGSTLRDEFKAAIHMDWDGFVAAGQAGGKRIANVMRATAGDSVDIWKSFGKSLEGIFNGTASAAPASKSPTTSVDLNKEGGAKARQAIQARIDLLAVEAAAALRMAEASGQSAAALVLETAAKNANVLVSELRAKAVDKEGNPVKALTDLIDGQIPKIRALEALKASGGTLSAFGKKITEETARLEQQAVGMSAMADAYARGGDAVESAKIGEALSADNAGLAVANELFAELSKMPGVASEALKKYEADIASATTAVAKHGAAIRELDLAKYQEELAKSNAALQGQAPLLDTLNAAYMQNEEAVRNAQVSLQLFNWEQAHPGATPEMISAITSQYKQQSDEQYASQVAQEAGALSINKIYDATITKIKDARAEISKNGQSTLLVDAKLYDAQLGLNKQWDDAALKVGNFHQKLAALLDELKASGENLGENVFKSFSTAISGVSDQLAKMVVTGKSDFKSLGQALEESIVKAGFQKATSNLAGGLMNKLGLGALMPGAGKPDGSQAAPFYVQIVGTGDSANLGLGPGFGSGSMLSSLGGLFAPKTTEGSSSGGGIGGFFGGLFNVVTSLLPHLAGGGDVSPGKAYVVGERHPELFVPSTSGRIVPNFSGAPKQNATTVNLHIHGVTDMDSFKKSQAQIASSMGSAVSRAQQRNR